MTQNLRLSLFILIGFFMARPAFAQGGGHQHDHQATVVEVKPIASGSRDPATVKVQQLADGYYLLTSGLANMILFTSQEASLVAGVQQPALVARATQLLIERKAAPIKYALAMSNVDAPAYGDGEWRQQSAQTITMSQENLYAEMRNRIRSAVAKGAVREDLPSLPASSFSNVVQLWLSDEEVHFVYERAGSSYADVVVHFEKEGILYLGGIFTNDGYPSIEPARGGSILDLVKTLNFLTKNFAAFPAKVEPIVPGRGPIATFADLVSYRNMIATIADRVQAAKAAGKTAGETVAMSLSIEFDERWGRGPVASGDFITAVYQSLK